MSGQGAIYRQVEMGYNKIIYMDWYCYFYHEGGFKSKINPLLVWLWL